MSKLKLLAISILCLVAGIYTLPMWALKCIGITLALCGAIAAYLVHLANATEIPEGVTQPDIVKQILITSKVLRFVAMKSEYFGFSGPAVLNGMYKYIAKTLPKPPSYNVTTEDDVFNGVPVRIFRPMPKETKGDDNPTDSKPGRAVLYLHGGGFIFGSIDDYAPLCSMMCEDLQTIFVSVEYRLAPDHVFPAAFEDALTAAEYLLEHAGELRVDSTRLAIMGDSAGGTLAASVSQKLNDKNFKKRFKMQVMVYPPLQALDFDTPSMRAHGDAAFLSRDFISWFYNYYLFGNQRNFNKMRHNNHTPKEIKELLRTEYMQMTDLPQDEILRDYVLPPPSDGDHTFWSDHQSKFLNPDISPLMANPGTLAGLPHTFILSCQNDVLRDDAYHYEGRLRREGVKVEHVCAQRCYHGWWSAGAIRKVDTFREHYQTLVKYVDKHL